jgi:HAE1 family hydrophobic/amphiphilic exporter-1
VNVSALFIQRPIATSLVMLGIGVFGVVAYRALPVADLPTVAYPSITVTANLPGADPVTMASAVASPLERQFTTIAGIDSMTSSSTSGSTSISITFELDRDIDGAAVDVQTAIATAMPLLPAGMPSPPSFKKSNPADDAILFIALTSRTVPLSQLDEYAETMVSPRLSMLNGVAQIDVRGAQKYAVRVRVDPDKIQANQIGINEVDQALQNWNANLPTGQLFGPTTTYLVKASGQLMNAAAFRPLVVAYRHGAPVRLEQIAEVVDSVEDNRSAAWVYTKETGSQPAVAVGVRTQANANTIEVANAVRSLLPEFRAALPPAVRLIVRGDRSVTIREAFRDIQITMLMTLALVVGVIFLFLRNGPATCIPSLALPFSLLGTLALMQVLGFSLDNLSMMALVLSIGFVVDDAIVMLENIVRHIEAGLEARRAAFVGSQEVAFTILSMTVSLAAAFVPILFMRGVLGRVFREFAITITMAIVFSGVVSVTLTPMLCSRFLRRATVSHAPGAPAHGGRLFAILFRGYAGSLRVVLRHRVVMLGVFLLVLAATIAMGRLVATGFVPEQDNDALNITVRAAQGTSFDQTVTDAQAVGSVLRGDANVDAYQLTIGGNTAMNTATIAVQLAPRVTRTATAGQIAQRIRQGVARFADFRAFVTVPPSIQIGSRRTASTYSVVAQSIDAEALYAWADPLERTIADLPEVQDVSNDAEIKSPRVILAIDRDKAAAMGVTATYVENTLFAGLGPKWSTTIYGTTAQYRVLLELEPQYQRDVDALRHLSFKTPGGALVPLETILSAKEAVGPQSINHTGQLPAVAITFGLRPGRALGDAVGHINTTAGGQLPAGMTLRFEGAAKIFQDSLSNLGLLLAIAVAVVYIVLGMLYESFIHPITILSGLPSAGLGALVALWLFGNELNIYSFVGLIMLVGIVKKNAIMQIDFALDAQRTRGLGPVEAIYEGCLIRFRPIMMTTMAALTGAMPIALGFGTGGEARRPLGIAVVGGLVVSQLITLYLTPVVYTYMASLAGSAARDSVATA